MRRIDFWNRTCICSLSILRTKLWGLEPYRLRPSVVEPRHFLCDPRTNTGSALYAYRLSQECTNAPLPVFPREHVALTQDILVHDRGKLCMFSTRAQACRSWAKSSQNSIARSGSSISGCLTSSTSARCSTLFTNTPTCSSPSIVASELTTASASPESSSGHLYATASCAAVRPTSAAHRGNLPSDVGRFELPDEPPRRMSDLRGAQNLSVRGNDWGFDCGCGNDALLLARYALYKEISLRIDSAPLMDSLAATSTAMTRICVLHVRYAMILMS